MTISHLVATVKAVDDGSGTGTFEAVASTPTLDRDGEIVAAGAFNPLPASVPIHVDHKMDSEGLVGTGRPFYVGDTLKVTGRFAGTPRAQIIRQLVIEGHLRTMSVVFMGAEVERVDGKPPLVKRAELLAVDFVTVPSNRGALVTSARSFGRRSAGGAARSVAMKAIIDLALLEVAELDRKTAQTRARARAQARPAPIDHRAVLRQAEALLAQLKGRP